MRLDLTQTVKLFYQKLRTWVSTDTKFMNYIVEKQADIKVNYLKRADLPIEIRPEERQRTIKGKEQETEDIGSLLGKRKRSETTRDIEAEIKDDVAQEIV